MPSKANIFVVGGSFGGNAAARAFYRLEVAGVVSMCAPLHTAFQYPPDALDGLPKLTIDGVKSRFGLLDRSTAALSAPLSEVSLIKQGYMRADKTIDTPTIGNNYQPRPGIATRRSGNLSRFRQQSGSHSAGHGRTLPTSRRA